MDEEENSEEKDGFGLDKDRRLEERRERYRIISFEPSMLFR